MDYCIMQQKDIEKCALTLMKAFKPSVKFYEANGFKADESLVFMAADV